MRRSRSDASAPGTAWRAAARALAAGCLALAAAAPATAQGAAGCDEPLKGIGKSIERYRWLYDRLPERLSELWDGSFVTRIEDFACAGSGTTIGDPAAIDDSSDFRILTASPADDRTPLVATRARLGQPGRALLADLRSVVPYQGGAAPAPAVTAPSPAPPPPPVAVSTRSPATVPAAPSPSAPAGGGTGLPSPPSPPLPATPVDANRRGVPPPPLAAPSPPGVEPSPSGSPTATGGGSVAAAQARRERQRAHLGLWALGLANLALLAGIGLLLVLRR